MIDVQKTTENNVRLVVSGNQSMSWRANLLLAGSLAVICLGIAFAMAAFGFWMVIPFAGAEVVFIVTCLYLTLKRLSLKEVITVGDNAIRLEWGYTRPETSVSLPRQWSRLQFKRSDSPFDVGELHLTAHGKRYLLGERLGRDEKKTLHTTLSALLSSDATA